MAPKTNNPVAYTYTDPNSSIPRPGSISQQTYNIAGIETHVFGLAELASAASCPTVTVLWLLHPRLQTFACMTPFASHFISSWNDHSGEKRRKGLIAVAFDQRNHGKRLVTKIANEAWRSGNEMHAQDMFSCYHGTAVDTSMLLDFLSAYIFPTGTRKIEQNIVIGTSLGGHAAWHVIMSDPRFSAAIVTIGCPDYTRLMSDRARLSKRKTWTEGQGKNFLGSKDFPTGLMEAVTRFDPAGLIFSQLDEHRQNSAHHTQDLTGAEKSRLMPIMTRCFGNKKILNLSGGSDKLVPYAMGKPFLDWLKRANAKDGFFDGSGFVLQDVVVPGAGHEVPVEMVEHMQKFILAAMEDESEMTAAKLGNRDSKI